MIPARLSPLAADDAVKVTVPVLVAIKYPIWLPVLGPGPQLDWFVMLLNVPVAVPVLEMLPGFTQLLFA
jgi:hypothetical protein